MSANEEAAPQHTEDQSDHDGDQGIQITSGEPNTFEPEEDPEAAPDPS